MLKEVQHPHAVISGEDNSRRFTTVVLSNPPTVILNLIQELSFRIQLLPDNDIFKAHFPGYPITPGAIQVRVATELLQKSLRSMQPAKSPANTPTLRLSSVSNLKFIAPIYPDDEVTYSFTNIKASDGTATTTLEISAHDGIRSKMFLEYAII
ncbi:MAG: hypothetical protein PUK70_00820 [Bacteroidales bacterium]|nr:hypothetical protein [Bacteroidales bacterium]MDY6001517.1 hypothetical protein [Candidatus Cryptobacteroides sp.]